MPDCCGDCSPEDLLKPLNEHGCSPGNGGIGGILPYCRACGALVPPIVPCRTPNCDHRILGG